MKEYSIIAAVLAAIGIFKRKEVWKTIQLLIEKIGANKSKKIEELEKRNRHLERIKKKYEKLLKEQPPKKS